MDKFLGKWEMVPELTENGEEWAKVMVPEEMREMYKNMVYTTTVSKDGDKVVILIEVKGQPTMKQELKFELGVPLTYIGLDGANMTSTMELFKGDKVVEKHHAEMGGMVKDWEVQRRVEGDMTISVSTHGGITMTDKSKKI